MQLPTQPVTLDAGKIEEFNQKLSGMRHDINNTLSLIVAAVELIRCKPQLGERMLSTLVEQPPKISASMREFTEYFEQLFGITRP